MSNAILQRFDLSGKVVVITGGGGELCGAMVVTRHGCSISMPFWDEVMDFADERGGL